MGGAVGYVGRGCGRFRHGPPIGWAALEPQQAGPTTIIAQYPGAIDVKPDLAEDVTPLSAQFLNHVTQIVEAIQAEIGILPEMSRKGDAVTNWKDLLGGISLPHGDGRNKQGQLFGVQVVTVTYAAQDLTVSTPFNITNNYGRIYKSSKEPILFAICEHPGPPWTLQDWVNGSPFVVGQASFSTTAPVINCRIIGISEVFKGGGWVPVGTIPVHIVVTVFYMPTFADA